ncbi:MAG: thioesterase, partial [Alcanivorax sp.]|nr:thioesterase [Alcanivorax sp.]
MSNLAEMTGLQALQYALDNDDRPGIGRTMEFTLVELEEGRVVFEGTPTEKVYNPIGTVHGGYAATLLDSACGCAVHSTLAAGQGYST